MADFGEPSMRTRGSRRESKASPEIIFALNADVAVLANGARRRVIV
jgi:hypothetical protein